MKAALIRSAEAQAEYAEFAEPAASEGREIVELVAAGIHPVVRALASGAHYGSPGVWPSIPGIDAVARTAEGALVFTGFPESPFGTLAERIAVPSSMRLPLPQGADPARIAAGLNPGLSSWMPLTARVAEVGALGTVLVLGATGVAGMLAIQNALILGAARVVGVGRNATGLARAAAAGAAASVPLTGQRDADAAAIATALGRAAPSLVLDFVWGTPAESAFHALGGRGLEDDDSNIAYVQIGSTAGAEASVPASLLRSRRIRLTGSGAGSATIADIMVQLPVYMQYIADGDVTVPVQTYPLSRVADAWAASAGSRDRIVVLGDDHS